MKQELYAFWKYDQFPYVLGGTVTKMNEDGSVQIKEYGNGSFNPVKIVPIKAGLIIKQSLAELSAKREAELKKVHGLFRDSLEYSFPFCLK